MFEITDIDQDFVYVGEVLQKNRIKQNGHTYRRRRYSTDCQPSLSRCLNGKKNGKAQYFEKQCGIAVTDIDFYYDYGFWRGKNNQPYSFYQRDQVRFFNRPDLWEEVEEILEENAVHITKEYRRFENQVIVHYDIPVKGHIFYPNTFLLTKRNKIEEHWFLWNGKYYDPSYIYQFVNNNGFNLHYNYSSISQGAFEEECSHGGRYFRKVCPLIEGKDPQMALGRTEDGKKNRLAAVHLKSTRKNRDPTVEIDLKRVCNVTHIGTLGGYPNQLSYFPEKHDEYLYEKYSNHLKKIRKSRYRRYPGIWLIKDESELSWVTQYKLEYRDINSGKWLQYEHSFLGNKDVCTEKIHNVSLTARYLRITPLLFHNKKSMRILVYGEGVSQKMAEPAEDIQTIRYTVTPPPHRFMVDGYRGGGGCNCEYCKGLENKKLKREMIQDEIQDYYKAIY